MLQARRLLTVTLKDWRLIRVAKTSSSQQQVRSHQMNKGSRQKKFKMEEMKVITSANDKKSYRVINLDNGLTAMLISDPPPDGRFPAAEDEKDEAMMSEEEEEEEGSELDAAESSEEDEGSDAEAAGMKTEKQSSAALCVGLGSFCDPPDIPGFAHFLEHMVFMGSEKYPKENELDDYLGKHGGDSNAWTDCEKTLFHFQIQRKHFHKALDRFAHFFISPLLRQDSVDRERQAVDSEFQMTIPMDDERLNQLIKTSAKQGHPMRMFMCGNMKSLKTNPENHGMDIYAGLRDFCHKMYSAQYMTLAVQSMESLDSLEQLVCEVFSEIPNNNLPKPSFEHLKDPFDTAEFRKIYKVIPVEDVHKVEICWALPSLVSHYRAKPLEYLSTLVQHEGAGSILSYLKKRLWALAIMGGNGGGGFEHNSTWSCFYTSITLTEAGLEHVMEVVTVVFQYIHMLMKQGPIQRIFEEQKQIEEAKFRWKEPGDPMEYVEEVAENMQLYPPEHFLTGKSQLYDYDEELIQKCTEQLQPDGACITVMSKTLEGKDICHQEEEWYGTKYCVTEVDKVWQEKWRDLELNPDMFIPDPNPFIATDFSLRDQPGAGQFPSLAVDSRNCKLWYMKDDKFHVPKGFAYLNLSSPVIVQSLENATLCDLFINLLQQNLTESLYPAVLAGYEYSVEGFPATILLQIEGFSHKLPLLLREMIRHITDFTCSPEFFQAVLKQMEKSYFNEMIKPFELAKMLRFALLEVSNPPIIERCRIASTLTPEMLDTFLQEFRTTLFVEGFLIGNFTQQEVEEMGKLIQENLLIRHLDEEQKPKKMLLKVPSGEHHCRVRSLNKGDSNCCITNYYQATPGDIHKCCLNDLLITRMREPCFDVLRTKHQLGYSVFCQSMLTCGILGVTITVESQAHKFSMDHVEELMTRFLVEFEKTLTDMTSEEFESLVATVITSKRVEDTHLGETAVRFWREIDDQFYVFDRLDREISELNTVTRDELLTWYRQFVNSGARKLSVQVEGCEDTKMETEPSQAENACPHKDDGDVIDAIAEDRSLHFHPGDNDGKRFIKDIKDFRKTLVTFPYTRVVS